MYCGKHRTCAVDGAPLNCTTLAPFLRFLSLTLTPLQQPLNTIPTQDCLAHYETTYGTNETKCSEKNLGRVVKNCWGNVCLRSQVNRFKSSRRFPVAER